MEKTGDSLQRKSLTFCTFYWNSNAMRIRMRTRIRITVMTFDVFFVLSFALVLIAQKLYCLSNLISSVSLPSSFLLTFSFLVFFPSCSFSSIISNIVALDI